MRFRCYSESMLFDGFIGAIIGAVIGALITVVFSWWMSRSQRREDRQAAATRSAEEKEAAEKRLTHDKVAAAKRQSNDIARVAHLLVMELQAKTLRIAGRSALCQNSPDIGECVRQVVSDLTTSLTEEKSIIAQLDQCCPTQKNRVIDLEKNALEASITVQGDAVQLFNICMDLYEGLNVVRIDLADMIREV